jgi:hypothetical protein
VIDDDVWSTECDQGRHDECNGFRSPSSYCYCYCHEDPE